MLPLTFLTLAGLAVITHRFTAAGIFGVLAASSAAFAQDVVPDPENIEAFARVVLDAVSSGNWGLVASLAVIVAVFLVRKFGAKSLPFITTDRGGALLVLITAVAGAVCTAMLAGSALSPALIGTAFLVALKAAGGFALLKKIFFPSDGVAKAEAVGLTAADLAKAGAKSPMDLVNGK